MSLRMTSQCFCMKSTSRPRRVHRDAMDAMADLGGRIGDVLGPKPPVDGPPSLAAVVGAERTRRGNGDEYPLRVARIQKNRVQAHPAGARLPVGSGAVAAQTREFLPRSAAVGRTEQCGVFHAGVDGVRIGERRLQMPDSLELPRMRRAVIPLVRAGRRRHRRTCCQPAPRSCHHRSNAGSIARTSRSTAKRIGGSGQRAIPLRGTSPSLQNAGR